MASKETIKLSTDKKLFLLGVLFKQFYVLPSGFLQLGDIFMLLSFLSHFYPLRTIPIQNEDNKLKVFIGCICLINGIYSALYLSVAFFLSIFYYIFNFCIVLVFGRLMYDRAFLSRLKKVLVLNLLIQLGILVSGSGRTLYTRYQGTFNDPNQYGFFILSTFLLISLIDNIDGKIGYTLACFVLSLILIFPSASTGMLLAFGLFIVFFVIFSEKLQKKDIIRFLLILIILLCVIVLADMELIKLPNFINDSLIYQRLMHKINNFSEDSRDLIKDRQWNKVFLYPEKLLYGAGEGYFQRFNSISEIHSSILGPLWYYGIVPCSFWFSWCYSKIKKVNKSMLCVYIALIIESITLVHNRQPFFWMIFVLAGCSSNQTRSCEIHYTSDS